MSFLYKNSRNLYCFTRKFERKDWVSNSALNDLASQGEEENWGKFLTIGKAQQKLAKDVAILKSAEGNFETFVKALSVTDDKVSFHKKWIEKSGQIAKYVHHQAHTTKNLFFLNNIFSAVLENS